VGGKEAGGGKEKMFGYLLPDESVTGERDPRGGLRGERQADRLTGRPTGRGRHAGKSSDRRKEDTRNLK
jgi:hypothetical protein